MRLKIPRLAMSPLVERLSRTCRVLSSVSSVAQGEKDFFCCGIPCFIFGHSI